MKNNIIGIIMKTDRQVSTIKTRVKIQGTQIVVLCILSTEYTTTVSNGETDPCFDRIRLLLVKYSHHFDIFIASERDVTLALSTHRLIQSARDALVQPQPLDQAVGEEWPFTIHNPTVEYIIAKPTRIEISTVHVRIGNKHV